ncbi:MAG TPA: hypothetical protein VM308_08385 [Sphingomicrobium sp.]|nr:hypothetical protein [Sphingomicrobium sp.]
MKYYYGAPSHLRKAPAAPGREPSIAPATEAQARCDAIQAEYRASAGRPSIRREAPPLSPAQVPTDDPLLLRLAEELEYARRMLDLMGDELTSDPMVVGRHMTSLQTVDIAGQILGHIASVIRSSDPPGAVEQIGMADLKGRLQRKQGVL